MSRQIPFYDHYTAEIVSPWWLYVLVGLNLVLLAVLIMLFPPLVVYLVASFLLFDGAVFLLIGFRLRRFKKRYTQWRAWLWEPLT